MAAELVRHDGWAELVLNRPERKNAITGPMGVAISECLAAVDADESIQVVLLRGAGGAFCSGLDLKEFNADPAPDWLPEFQTLWRGAHRALYYCPVPIIGALLATWIPREMLKPIMLATMIVMAALIVFRKQTLIAGEGPPLTPSEAPRSNIGLFFAGVYGGFIQAGVGFLLLGVLVGTLRHNLITANALKLVVTLAFGTVSLGIFVWAGMVSWTPAIVLAASSIVGARLGVRLRWLKIFARIQPIFAIALADPGLGRPISRSAAS